MRFKEKRSRIIDGYIIVKKKQYVIKKLIALMKCLKIAQIGLEIVKTSREARYRRNKCFFTSICIGWKWRRTMKLFGPSLEVRLEKTIK